VHQPFIDFKKAYDSVRREVIHNILIEFGIPKKQARLIKKCLTETYSSPGRQELVWRVSCVMNVTSIIMLRQIYKLFYASCTENIGRSPLQNFANCRVYCTLKYFCTSSDEIVRYILACYLLLDNPVLPVNDSSLIVMLLSIPSLWTSAVTYPEWLLLKSCCTIEDFYL